MRRCLFVYIDRSTDSLCLVAAALVSFHADSAGEGIGAGGTLSISSTVST